MLQGFQDHTAIGKYLRRLSNLLDHDAKRVYRAKGLHFEQRWFGILNQLVLSGPMSVSEIAEVLRITHVSVSETRKSLEAGGYICSYPCEVDGRRRLLDLTDEGRSLFNSMTPVWQAFEEVSVILNAEAQNVIGALTLLDAALEKKSLFDRAMERLP